jgi:putative tricarboxylic transport membrane protein
MNRWKELICAFLLTMVVIYLFIEVGKENEIIKATLRGYSAMSRPGFWPRVMLVGLLVTGLLKLFLIPRKSDDRQAKQSLLKLLLVPKVMMSIAIVGMYCYLSQYLGFAFSTAAFTAVYMRFLGMKKWKLLVLFPICSTFVTLLIFWRLLYVSLPKGEGIFLSFSNLIMGIIRFGT